MDFGDADYERMDKGTSAFKDAIEFGFVEELRVLSGDGFLSLSKCTIPT